MHRLHLRTLAVAVGLCLAVGALGGVAAADHAGDLKISVAVDDDGGYFSVLCTGSPTDHDCDKSGRLDAGPASVDYRGFNNDSLAGGYSRFGDKVVVTVGDRQYTVAFTCEFTDEPPEESPCRPDGDGEDPEGDDDGGDDSGEDGNENRENRENRENGR